MSRNEVLARSQKRNLIEVQALAADPNLDYCSAVELQLLLEELGAKSKMEPDLD